MKFSQILKSTALTTTLCLNTTTQTQAHPGFLPSQEIVEQELKEYQILKHANTTNTTCHQVLDNHQLCIINNSQQIDPKQVARRFQETLMHTFQSLNIPASLHSKQNDTTTVIIAKSQPELEQIMQQINVKTYWGYFLENLIPYTNMTLVFANNNQQMPWQNAAHELGHAAFSLVIGDHLEARDFCQKFHINHKVIWEGFAEFFKYANNQTQINPSPRADSKLIQHILDFPEIYNPNPDRKKLYSIQNLIFNNQVPHHDRYFYGRLFFSFLKHKHPHLLQLLMISIKTKAIRPMQLFVQQIQTDQINHEFQTHQTEFMNYSALLNQVLLKHVQNLYNKSNEH